MNTNTAKVLLVGLSGGVVLGWLALACKLSETAK